MDRRGFSLIELLIVVTLVVMLMLAASTIFLTFLVSNSQVNSDQLVKQEGQYALAQMEFLLRNALELEPNTGGIECESGMTEIKLRSLDGATTTLMAENDGGITKIASNSGLYLTSDAVEVTSGPIFNCSQDSDQGQPHIELEFELRKGDPATDLARDVVAQEFATSTVLRSL